MKSGGGHSKLAYLKSDASVQKLVVPMTEWLRHRAHDRKLARSGRMTRQLPAEDIFIVSTTNGDEFYYSKRFHWGHDNRHDYVGLMTIILLVIILNWMLSVAIWLNTVIAIAIATDDGIANDNGNYWFIKSLCRSTGNEQIKKTFIVSKP